MKRFGFIHPLLLSFFSKPLYQDVAFNWQGVCLGYLLSLVALCAIPAALKMQADISDYLDRESPAFINQMPVITISGGKASIDKPEPYLIMDEKTKTPRAIIDTTGKMTSLKGSPAYVLLTKTEVIVKRKGADAKAFELSGIDNVVIDRSSAYDFLDNIEEWMAVLLYPFIVFFSFLYRAVEVLVFTLIASIIARALKRDLNFRSLVRLSAISVTPAAIGGAILTVVNVDLLYWSFISFAISFGYVVFALKASSR